MNPILAAALAMFPDALNVDMPKPKTPDPDRQAAAQAKRERKAAKRISNYAKGELGNAHIFMAKRKYEYMSKEGV